MYSRKSTPANARKACTGASTAYESENFSFVKRKLIAFITPNGIIYNRNWEYERKVVVALRLTLLSPCDQQLTLIRTRFSLQLEKFAARIQKVVENHFGTDKMDEREMIICSSSSRSCKRAITLRSFQRIK